MNRPQIGFIGIGIMGEPMAGHIAEAGYNLAIHDIDLTRAESVASMYDNVIAAGTPRKIAEMSDIVITMLPSGVDVRGVAMGKDGLIEGFVPGAMLLDCSSSEPWLTIETAGALAEKGVGMMDAPVSGARTGAESADLVFMVGGEEGHLSRVRPLLQILGRSIFHLGPLGSGHAMKCINNLITAVTFMATTEGLAIGKKYGLDPNVMTDVLNVSTGMSWISKTHIKERILSGKFDDPFKLRLMIKDIRIALELADRKGIPVPLAGLGQHLWRAAGRYSDNDGSISNMVRWVEDMTGIRITPGSVSESHDR